MGFEDTGTMILSGTEVVVLADSRGLLTRFDVSEVYLHGKLTL